MILEWFYRNKRKLPGIDTSHFKHEDLRALIGRDDPVILDLGANDGGATEMFLKQMPGATIHAVEPDPRAIRRFRERLGDDSRVHLHELAIGAHDGVTTFHQSGGAPNDKIAERMPDGWDLSGSIRKPKKHLETVPWCTFDNTIEVAVTRLDTWSSTHCPGPIDFIWADLQGAEGDMIAEGGATFARSRFLFMEYDHEELYAGQETLVPLLKCLPDFKVEKLYQYDVFLRNTEIDGGD